LGFLVALFCFLNASPTISSIGLLAGGEPKSLPSPSSTDPPPLA
jgi:hypothetical protein